MLLFWGPMRGSQHGAGSGESLPEVDTSERGRPVDGRPQRLDRRLFFLLTAWRVPPGFARPSEVERVLATALRGHGVPSVVYRSVTDPRALAVLTWSEDEGHFTGRWRDVFDTDGEEGLPLAELEPCPELTMFGRTYTTGYEEDIEYWLIRRPVETVLEPRWNWAVWYPLRRTGAFARLEPREQGAILREHGLIGRAYAEKDLAHDVRLACHGLDANDNEFVIGLIGARLQPLSHVVQAMRRTRQTSEFVEKMGPFFVGRAVHRIAG